MCMQTAYWCVSPQFKVSEQKQLLCRFSARTTDLNIPPATPNDPSACTEVTWAFCNLNFGIFTTSPDD